MRYLAGQFTELRLPHRTVDERGDKRWFTLSSSPTDQLLSITTKFSPEKGSSFKQQLQDLQPGAKVHLAEPMGDFVLPQKQSIPIIFVAGGIGITPMHSMVKWLVDSGERRDIHLLYAVESSDELAFQELFTSAPISYTPMVRQTETDWHGAVGHITSQAIMGIPGVDKDALVYISGPEPMVEQLNKELQEHGVPDHRVIGDYFPGYPAP